jgi:hypothetical protein
LSSENEPEEDLQNLQEFQDSSATSKATTSASQTHLHLHQELLSETEPEEDLQHLQESQDSSDPCRISSARHCRNKTYHQRMNQKQPYASQCKRETANLKFQSKTGRSSKDSMIEAQKFHACSSRHCI